MSLSRVKWHIGSLKIPGFFTLRVLRLHDYHEVCKFALSSRRGTSVVRCMNYSRSEDRVYVFLDDGDIVVCSAEFSSTVDAPCSPVVRHYPGNGLSLRCAALVASSTRFGTGELITVVYKSFCNRILFLNFFRSILDFKNSLFSFFSIFLSLYSIWGFFLKQMQKIKIIAKLIVIAKRKVV